MIIIMTEVKYLLLTVSLLQLFYFNFSISLLFFLHFSSSSISFVLDVTFCIL